MVDVFISYSHEDYAHAAELAQLLEEAQYVVWWDRNLVGGTHYRDIIDEKLKQAKKVIVLWSASSVGAGFVIDEAQEAKDLHKLIPIVIDNCKPPLGFRDIHTLYIKKFQAVAETIVASIEDKPLAHTATGWRIWTLRRTVLAPALISVCGFFVLGIAFLLFHQQHTPTALDLATSASVYSSDDLNAVVVFPINVLSLDTTQRKNSVLILRDGDGQARVKIARSPPAEIKDIHKAQQQERDQLERLGFTVTYAAPEKDTNWSNWYVLSGLANGTVFYYRRWLYPDNVASIEFTFPKSSGKLYEDVIPMMMRGLIFSEPYLRTHDVSAPAEQSDRGHISQ